MGYLDELRAKQAALKAEKSKGKSKGAEKVNPPEAPKHNSREDVEKIAAKALPRLGLRPESIEAPKIWSGEARDEACKWLAEITAADGDEEIGSLLEQGPKHVLVWIEQIAERADDETPEPEEAPKPKPKATKPKATKPKATQVEPETSNGPEPGAGITMLLVGCWPTKVAGRPPVRLTDIARELEPVGDSPHYRLTEYGKGPALLEIAMGDHLETNGYGCVYVDPFSTVGQDLLAVCEAHARIVIRKI